MNEQITPQEDNSMEMISSRRREVEMGTDITSAQEEKAIAMAISDEKERQEKKLKEMERIKKSRTYQRIDNIATYMDKFFLDPIIGLIPTIGDFLSIIFIFPFLRISLFTIRSLPLTLAVIFNITVDVLLGSIPWIGIIGDIFYRANLRNFRLIKGFVEDDKEIIADVNKKAIWMAIGIIVVILLIYWIITSIASFLNGLFN